MSAKTAYQEAGELLELHMRTLGGQMDQATIPITRKLLLGLLVEIETAKHERDEARAQLQKQAQRSEADDFRNGDWH